VAKLLGIQLESEVRRKPADVPSDLLIQPLGGDAIEEGEVAVEHHAMSSDEHDAALERLTGNHGMLLTGKTRKLEVAICDLKMVSVAGVAELLTMRSF
jgi:hypothetical protein